MLVASTVPTVYLIHLHVIMPICITLDLSLIQSGNTPLYAASGEGHVDVAALLLERGADLDKVHHCYDGVCYLGAPLQ